MSISRYDGTKIFSNEEEKYKYVLRSKNRKAIFHYQTPQIKNLSQEDYTKIKTLSHIWKLGDRLHKLAHTYYNDNTLWWLIAWFNQKPTDAHLELGDPVFIPIPLEDALYYYNTR